MKKSTALLAISAMLAAGSLTSCNETSEIGASIVQDRIDVIVDSTFTVTGYSKRIDKVQSRTVSQLLGRIDATGYGSLTSDIVTQFMSSSELQTENVIRLDSLMLYMYMQEGNYVGDSIAPMGLSVHRLNKILPSPIYSDFDPAGYYDPQPLATAMYNVMNQSADTVYSAGGIEIAVRLPDELMHELYNAYKANPANFASPTAFAENVFKGLYIKNSFGSGRLMRLSSNMMSLYYDYNDTENDTIITQQGNYFAVTPEIITNNDVQLEISPSILNRVDAGEAIVMGPVGMEVEIRFPAPEIMASYRGNGSELAVLNTVSFTVPGLQIENDLGLATPDYLLLVLSKDKDVFFAENKLPDSKTSFYAQYDATTGLYSFGDMRQYILNLLDQETVTAEDYTFTITPVSATFETVSSGYYYYSTSQVLSTITPYMAAPTMGVLDLSNAEIKLTYSTQTIQK